MRGSTMSKANNAKRALPAVMVTCTNEACGHHQFTSSARSHTRCPVCKRNLRVRRGPQLPSYTRAAESVEVVRREPTAAFSPAALAGFPASPLVAPRADGDQDDDGYAYIPSPDGKQVLADLTPDGRMIPVQLVDKHFRVIAPGYCSVYGCTGPARWMHDGWPVCDDCRLRLAA
jgi:hypothetical protein